MFDSSFRYGDSSFRHFGKPISEVDSANCQFDSSAGLLSRFVVTSCRFIVSLWRFVVSTRPLREAIIRRTVHEASTWFHALIHDVFIPNLLWADQVRCRLKSGIILWRATYGIENETGCLVTHFDTVLYIPRASSFAPKMFLHTDFSVLNLPRRKVMIYFCHK